MYKPRRESRYRALREAGLLTWEAQELSKLPAGHPVVRKLVEDTAREHRNFIRATERKARRTGKDLGPEGAERKWKTHRLQQAHMKYALPKTKGMKPKERREAQVSSAWRVFHRWEKPYEKSHPKYKSPWVARQRDFRKAKAKIELSLHIKALEKELEDAKKPGHDPKYDNLGYINAVKASIARAKGRL